MVDIVGIVMVVAFVLVAFVSIASWLFLRKGKDKSLAGAKPAAPSEEYVQAVLAEPEKAPIDKILDAQKAALESAAADLDGLQVSQAREPETIDDMGFLPPPKAPRKRPGMPKGSKLVVCEVCGKKVSKHNIAVHRAIHSKEGRK